MALYRRLYEEGFSEKQVVYTHLHIDLLLILPQPLMIRFRQEILAMEKDKNMPYLVRIPMKADTCSDSYRTLIRRYRTVVGAKRRSVVSNKELSDMRQENRA